LFNSRALDKVAELREEFLLDEEDSEPTGDESITKVINSAEGINGGGGSDGDGDGEDEDEGDIPLNDDEDPDGDE
jgi:hypothetical protein